MDDKNRFAFDIVLSIAMNARTFETLRLKPSHRQFAIFAPSEHYQYLRGEITRERMYEASTPTTKV